MTIPKALPPGVNHHAATRGVAGQMQDVADKTTMQAQAPKPDAPKRVMNAELPMKTMHRTVAK